jgi:hypothetical protein
MSVRDREAPVVLLARAAARRRAPLVFVVVVLGIATAVACGGSVAGGAASSGGGASADAQGDDALGDGGGLPGEGDSASTCTSGKTWTRGIGSGMAPGTDCTGCHRAGGIGPIFAIAGTVYPSLHEPDNCLGSPGALTVVVTDANGAVLRLPVNVAGNFYLSRTSSPPPYMVAVTDGVRTRAMVGSVTNGQCNTCHTEQGANGAPGRVVAP